MSGVLQGFHVRGRLNKPLLLLFAVVLLVLLANAYLHDPTAGYDAADHMHYVQALASDWRLPVKAETGQYYSPPLPYLLPAVLSSLHFGLWKALKVAQLVNVLLAAGLLVYLLKICALVAPDNPRLRFLSLGLLSLLPVFYRSFALIRGEPYLSFLALFVAYETLAIFLRQRYTPFHIGGLGIGLGLAILARQWGFFLFPPVLIFAMWTSDAKDRPRHLLTAVIVLVIAALVGGWFYILMWQRYGTLTAFDRLPQQPTPQTVSALFGLEADSAKLFTDPVRPSLSGRLLPIFYADAWGDYWGYFLVYLRNTSSGNYSDGAVFQKLTAPAQVGPGIVTNRFTLNRYLGTLNGLDLLPSALFAGGFIFGLVALIRFLIGRLVSDSDRLVALLAMMAGATLLGFLWFLLRYQTERQAGDLIKTTYVLQAFPAIACMAAGFVDRLWDRRPPLWRAVAVVLGLLFVAELPAFVTHYVHVAASPALVWVILSTVFLLSGLSLTYWIHTRYHLDIVAEPAPPPKEAPFISVCVPARNEASNIRACLDAILAQTWPNFEVIVLDDRSTDETPEVLKDFSSSARVRMLKGVELPEGWAGKPHALAQAAAVSRGEWLCFVDADTFLAPEALAASYTRAVATGADLFTMLTHQVTSTFWERVVMPLVMTALSVGFSPREVNDPDRRIAVANGQFILIKRSVYKALGGHERIKDQIVDDKALAELVKWNGYRLVLADGRHVARTRMYRSFPQMWEGWTKNIYLGLRDQPSLICLGAFGAFLLVLAALFLPIWPLLGLSWYLHAGGTFALLVVAQAIIVWLAVLYARAQVANSMRISRWYAFTLPLGAAVFAAMMIASAWKVLSGRGVTWRGRRYNHA